MLRSLLALLLASSAGAFAGPTNAILFVTQVPIPGDFTSIGSTFGNHQASPVSCGRGGDLYIRYPDGTVKNLTRAAGYGRWGAQYTNGIAVLEPCVHWSGQKAVFSMVVGAPRFQYDYNSVNYWQLYEITNFTSAGATPVITKVPNQPTNFNNVAPIYGTDDRIVFTRDRARFEREVDILAQLNHPNIVSIIDSGVAGEGGSFFYVMDYVAGDSLDTYMSREDRTLDVTLRLFARICDAVNAAHLKGIIHRDLKPSNIRVDQTGEPHILDFGLAKVAAQGEVSGEDPSGKVQMMTMTGQFVGSLPWASPEQAEGRPEKIDVRTDVYSLGVILYQMLTGGKFPYEVIGTMRDVLDNILRAAPSACSDSSIRTTT